MARRPDRADAEVRPEPELRAAFEAADVADVSDRPLDRLVGAHDASHVRVVPRLVASARTTDDVVAALRVARERGVPVTFRSGGTSLSGQAAGGGLLLDTRRGFRRVEVLEDGRSVRAQPGATLRAINARLARHGRVLGPDPASEIACTLGGVLANNSSGMACGTRHNAYATIASALLVLASGTVIDTGAEEADRLLLAAEPAVHAGLLALRDELRADPAATATIRRQFAGKNTMGYGLNSFLDHDEPVRILEHLAIGSEGTLAFIAEATLRTVELHARASTGLAVLPSVVAAARAVPALAAAGAATVELLDATSLRVAQRAPRAPGWLRDLDVREHAALLVEVRAGDDAALAAAESALSDALAGIGAARPVELTRAADERAALWHIRKGLYAAVAGAREPGTTALLEDIAVPLQRLGRTCVLLGDLLETHGYRDAVVFGHAKDGNLHFLLTERVDDADGAARLAAFTDGLVDLVLGEGGTLKAEHGTGRVMAPFVERQYGPYLTGVMWRVKRLLDPEGILNPGAVLSADPGAHLRDLKPFSALTDAAAPAGDCVECGYCEPSCPSRDLTLTPRARIVLRREIALARDRGDDALAADLELSERWSSVETCAADGMCAVACPVGIDTGEVVRRLRAERVGPVARAAGRLAADAWPALAAGASLAMSAAHALEPASAAATVALRRVLPHELVPRLDPGLPGGGRRRPRRADLAPAAVLLPSCTGQLFGPDGGHGGGGGAGGAGGGLPVAEAVLELARRAGVGLRTPERLDALCCGAPWRSKGHEDGARRVVDRTVAELLRASDDGALPVVVDASTCAAALASAAAGAAAGRGRALRVVDAVSWVAGHVLPHLAEPRRVAEVVLHPTCSDVKSGADLVTLAGALADTVTVPLDWGCCGFAGDRGLLHPELTASATAAEAAELADAEADAYCSTNRTCEIALTRATGRTYGHLLTLLELATRP
ncbi:FAD-binding and (Fe-S)-binding domain-containing protein [Salana multivorans]|mgnify:CR=1 FL=1|uniref:FAD-binding and (Fe-S)-binding domain-containing protein n=1 Tax=Salana multivorans TaxID=120377 RepID=UPI000AE040D9|nr:FAD-binding and (Fe-S)-binding domain-containing protein [Salana multivorans]